MKLNKIIKDRIYGMLFIVALFLLIMLAIIIFDKHKDNSTWSMIFICATFALITVIVTVIEIRKEMKKIINL